MSPSASRSTVESTAAASRLSSSTRPTPTRTSSKASGPPSLLTAKPASSSPKARCDASLSRAEANPDATFILVIDEINRGNVAKILGELYFLLEYRDEEVNLQYSNEPFSLPKNLWFIGTMNTTDRSIALVDAALRRRFYFFGFFPDEPPVKGLLSRWLDTEQTRT